MHLFIAGFGVVFALASLLIGCAPRRSQFLITDFRRSNEVTTYRTEFDEAYFDVDPQGNVDLVLRRVTPSEDDPRHPVTQIVHIKTFWRSMPGRTVASKMQLNGTVSYVLFRGTFGASFDGAGSVFFSFEDGEETLVGELERALLKPVRTSRDDLETLGHAKLEGQFRARRDPRKTTRIRHEIDRLLGPLPLYEVPRS